MTAFVAPTFRSFNVPTRRSFNITTSHTCRVPSFRAARMMCQEVSDASEGVDKVTEPYPGYVDDLRRMGVSEEEAIAQARKKMGDGKGDGSEDGGMKNLLKPDGTPYAPWMKVGAGPGGKRAGKKGGRDDGDGGKVEELNASAISWKMLGDELELRWRTGSEENNRGFAVYKRSIEGGLEWIKVADYVDAPAELATKGAEGGDYSFLVQKVETGSWAYRVADVDLKGEEGDLAQVVVEIESSQDSQVQKVALAALVAVLLLAIVVGLALDPLSST